MQSHGQIWPVMQLGLSLLTNSEATERIPLTSWQKYMTRSLCSSSPEWTPTTYNLCTYSTTQGEGSTFFSLSTPFKASQWHSKLNYHTTNHRALPVATESKTNPSYTHLPGKVFCCYLDTCSHHSMVHVILLFKKYRGILLCLNRVSRSNHAARIGSHIKYCLVYPLSRTLSARFLLFIIPAESGGNKELQELHWCNIHAGLVIYMKGHWSELSNFLCVNSFSVTLTLKCIRNYWRYI